MSGWNSVTCTSQIGRTAGSTMANGPDRQRGSITTNSVTVRAPITATTLHRAAMLLSANLRAIDPSMIPANTSGAAKLTAIASHTLRVQWPGPTLTRNARAVLAASPML
jgi:hypothetical protein